MIPLPIKGVYILGDAKINQLLVIDDLKIFAKSKTEIDSLVSTVKVLSHDFGMAFEVKTSCAAIMKRGKLVESEEISLVNGGSFKEIDPEGYKCLGILEAGKIKENEMKDMFLQEYLKHTKLILRSELNGRSKIMTANA